ncbi:MAG: hypothetical protein K1000chlam1_01115 [Candidatus Anoxychlamydiales bacterium]|nr:hypothetical protein [Candidatus Anoxychlamydiales bacterium]
MDSSFYKTKTKSSTNIVLLLLMLFIVVFPKGGIKYKSIPITWGYTLLALVSFTLLLRKRYSIRKEHLYVLLALLPFQIYSACSLFINGIENIGFAFSFFVSFFCLPFIFFFIFSEYIENLDTAYFFIILKRSIFFIACYGIFLFFYRVIVGTLLEIPLLTTNYHEKGIIETTKFIHNRGLFLKLISTYNNGNIFGLCLLMILPLYNYIEKNIFKKNIVKLSLIFTLSRTVWIGLIISEFFFSFFIIKNKHKSLVRFFMTALAVIAIIVFFSRYIQRPISWYFDKDMGGRVKEYYFIIKFLSHIPFAHIAEMIYFSVLYIFGFLGFILFIISMFSPIAFFTLKNIKSNISDIDKCIILGLATYLIVSFSDGALLYLPVMAFYWFLSSFLLSKKELTLEF